MLTAGRLVYNNKIMILKLLKDEAAYGKAQSTFKAAKLKQDGAAPRLLISGPGDS